jgi:predicted permease
VIQDLRHAVRLLRKNPGFTLVAILTMALGIGANTTVFSVVNSILLRPLPGLAEPSRLVSLSRIQDGNLFDNFAYPDFLDYRDRARSFAGLAGHCTAPLSMTADGASRVHGDLVTENYFDVLGTKAAAGRLLAPGDGNVAVINYGLWSQKFGRNPEIAGSRIVLNGAPFTIVGVAEAGFRGTAVDESIDVWVPISTQPVTLSRLSEGILEKRAAGWVEIFGRLKAGVPVRQADLELITIAGELAAAYPQTNRNRSVSVARGVGMYPDDRAEVTGLLGLLAGSVALLLLIACANVAGLFMVRASRRSREMAVRLAVGAGRGRLIRQLLAEGIVLAFAAGAVAILLAEWASVQIAAFSGSAFFAASGGLHRVDLNIDSRVLAFTVGACLLTGLLFAIVPAIQSSQIDVAGTLKNGSAGAGVRRNGFRSALVVSQIVLCFILVTASGTIVRDLHRIVTGNPGFDTKNVAMASVDMSTLPHFEERGRAFYRQLLERLPSVPGVVSASLAATVPPQDLGGRVSIFYPGQEPTPQILLGREFELGLRVDINRIAPRYFETLGIRLLRGRDFTERDHGVVIISRRLAEKLWPGEDAIGKQIAWPVPGGTARPPVEVIGVAADAKYRSLVTEAPLLMYAPVFAEYDSRTHIVVRTAARSLVKYQSAGETACPTQAPSCSQGLVAQAIPPAILAPPKVSQQSPRSLTERFSSFWRPALTYGVMTPGAPENVLADIERVARSIDKDVPIYRPETMAAHTADSLWQQRMAASWIGAFSLLALILAAVGLYGVIAQSVAQRTRELGIRMALGAAPASVSRLVLREGMTLALAGTLVGVPAALASERIMRRMLEGIGGAGLPMLTGVAILLALVTIAASWIPARRAARVDPVVALRYE